MRTLNDAAFFRLWVLLYFGFVGQSYAENDLQKKGDDWKRKYQKVYKFGDVYVVKSIYRFCDDYATWLADGKGNLLTPAYRDIGPFYDGRAEFVPKEGHDGFKGFHGYIDQKGKVKIPAKYRSSGDFENGKTWVIYPVDSLYGLSFIDTEGVELHRVPVELFPESFKIAKSVSANACHRDCDETIVWLKQGGLLLLHHELSDFTKKRISEFEGAYVLNYAGKFGYIDKRHILKTPVVLDSVDFSGRYSTSRLQRVSYNGKYGYVDRGSGEFRMVCQFEDTKPEYSGLLLVKKDGKWGCVDTLNQEKIPFRFDFIGSFAENGLAAVLSDGRFGHMDTSGVLIVPPVYDQVSYFKNGMAMVKKDGKFGYVDSSGNLTLPLQFDKASPFAGDVAIAEKWGMIYEIKSDGKMRLSGVNQRFTFWLALVLVILTYAAHDWFIRRSKRLSMD